MIKAYTDLGQSKRLAEFLPLDSADMRYAPFGDTHPWFNEDSLIEKDSVPCWSLASLIEIINKCCYYGVMLRFLCSTFDSFGNHLKNVWRIAVDTSEEPFADFDIYADNALDAAVNVILKLHEQKLL